MSVIQTIFKLEPPDFASQQIQIIPTDDEDEDNNNDKNHKSVVVSSVIPPWNRKIKEIQNLTMTMTSMMTTTTITMRKS